MAQATIIENQGAAPAPRCRFKGRYSNIGLDLGNTQIKLVQLKKRRGWIALHQYGICPLPPGTIEGGRIMDPLLLGERLHQLVKRRRLHKNRVNLCIGGQSVILRQITLPVMPSREIPAAVRWEAAKHIMFPLEEAVVDYSYIGGKVVDGSMVMELLLVVVPRDVVNGYIEVVTRAGLYPEIIEIEPFALHRAVRLALQDSCGLPENLLVLDIGGESSNLLVMEKDSYRFSRILNLGVNHFCRRVAETQQLDLEKARRLVFGREPFGLEGFTDVADDLVRQLKRSLDYYTLEVSNQETDFSEIVICGGGAFIPGLWTLVGSDLRLEPKLFNPLHFVDLNGRMLRSDLEQDGSLLQVAHGLALRGWLA